MAQRHCIFQLRYVNVSFRRPGPVPMRCVSNSTPRLRQILLVSDTPQNLAAKDDNSYPVTSSYPQKYTTDYWAINNSSPIDLISAPLICGSALASPGLQVQQRKAGHMITRSNFGPMSFPVYAIFVFDRLPGTLDTSFSGRAYLNQLGYPCASRLPSSQLALVWQTTSLLVLSSAASVQPPYF
jgi:hypothetical protein